MDKVNPWRRYRMGRTVKWVIGLTIFVLLLSWRWGLSFWETVGEAPGRIFDNMFVNPILGMPLVFTLFITALYGMFSLVIFFGIFFIGGVDTYKPGRDQDPLPRRLGPGPRAAARCKENIDFLDARRRSRSGAATCRAASCSGGRPAPARR